MTATALDATTALIVIDVQKAVLGLPYAHPIDEVVDNARRLVTAFRESGRPFVFTLVGPVPAPATRVDQSFARPGGGIAPDALKPVIDPLPGEHIIVKNRWGSFTGTDLEDYLRGVGATQVVLTGVATGFGVESTARNALELGFNITLAIDAMTDMDADIHHNSVFRVFPRLGECATTDEILSLADSVG